MIAKFLPVFCAFLLTCVLTTTASGQEQEVPPSPPNLAVALSNPEYTGRASTLSITAEKIRLPPKTALNKSGSIQDMANSFGLVARKFGNVTAVAPAAMVVLNSKPGRPNLFDTLAPSLAFENLLIALDPAQYKLLTSVAGLAYRDLSSPMQQQLFLASLPHQGLYVRETDDKKPFVIATEANKSFGDAFTRLPDHKDQVKEARLRLGIITRILFPAQPANGAGGASGYTSSVLPGKYFLLSDGAGNDTTVAGLQTRAVLPNALKKGDLDYRAGVFQTAVMLEKAATVGAVVQKIAQITGVELFVDPRYQKKAITFHSREGEVRCSEVLQALSFCLTGCYRKIGTAYVLTYDTVGLAVVKSRWHQIEKEIDAFSLAQKTLAEKTLQNSFDEKSISALDAASTLTEGQNAGGKHAALGVFDIVTTFDRLSEAQREEARRVAAVPDGTGSNAQAKLGGHIRLLGTVGVELLLPDVNAPVFVPGLADPLQWLIIARRAKAAEQSEPTTATGEAVDLGTTLRRLTVRAIRIKPDQVAKLPRLLPALQKIGINQIWLDVFGDGTDALGPNNASGDVLAQAFQSLKGSGITLIAGVSPFNWGRSTSAAVADEMLPTDDGKKAAKNQRSDREIDTSLLPFTPGSPFADAVQQRLATLAGQLASRKEIAGVALFDTAPSGYNVPEENRTFTGLPEFGYTQAARYAFLRQAEADPLDIDTLYERRTRANLSLPEFDDPTLESERMLSTRWNRFRRVANEDTLRRFFQGVTKRPANAKPDFFFFVQQRDNPFGDVWFGRWGEPSAPLPETSPVMGQVPSSAFIKIEKITVGANTTASELARQITESIKAEPWYGVVLEVEDKEGNTADDKEMDALEAFLIRRGNG